MEAPTHWKIKHELPFEANHEEEQSPQNSQHRELSDIS